MDRALPFGLRCTLKISLRFTAHLASLDLSYQTTRLYLCAVLHLQIVNKLPEPSLASYPLLNYALRGFVEESVE